MTNSADAARSPVHAARAPRTGRREPRRQPPAVFVIWGVLLALTTAALLDVLPLTEPAVASAAFAALVAVIILAAWSQLHHWGTLIAPSFAPSRFAVVIFGASMALLLSNFPDAVGLPVRIGLALLAPVIMAALLAWDDADTVAKLREEQEKQTRGDGTAPGRV